MCLEPGFCIESHKVITGCLAVFESYVSVHPTWDYDGYTVAMLSWVSLLIGLPVGLPEGSSPSLPKWWKENTIPWSSISSWDLVISNSMFWDNLKLTLMWLWLLSRNILSWAMSIRHSWGSYDSIKVLLRLSNALKLITKVLFWLDKILELTLAVEFLLSVKSMYVMAPLSRGL